MSYNPYHMHCEPLRSENELGHIFYTVKVTNEERMLRLGGFYIFYESDRIYMHYRDPASLDGYLKVERKLPLTYEIVDDFLREALNCINWSAESFCNFSECVRDIFQFLEGPNSPFYCSYNAIILPFTDSFPEFGIF